MPAALVKVLIISRKMAKVIQPFQQFLIFSAKDIRVKPMLKTFDRAKAVAVATLVPVMPEAEPVFGID